MPGLDLIMLLVQWLFGLAVKHWPVLKDWPNKLIPVFNFVLGTLVKLAENAATAAHAGDSLLTMPPTHVSFWTSLWHFFGPVLLNTIIATGTHTTIKNVWQQVLAQTERVAL